MNETNTMTDQFREAMQATADAINDEMGEPVTVIPALAGKPNFQAQPQTNLAVTLTAVFTRVPEMVFRERAFTHVQDSPGISSSKPRFSFKTADLPWPIEQGFRIQRADGEQFEVTSAVADSVSRTDVSVVQVGRPRA
jgi:hypothetical protein